ncbi:MAG: propionyl-CoA synthetase [Bernardetiaceae bacterium]|nr:propionyl-CoA synthetase [Bernardetiaceae bacterium]
MSTSNTEVTATYQEVYQQSIQNPEDFWRNEAEKIAWYEFPKQILSQNTHGYAQWYEGGMLNTSYLALDYHIENGRAEQLALIYDSPASGVKMQYTFRELRDEVARLAGVLKSMGVEKGDRVVIYMPMMPQAAMAMLACARLGAIHSVVFGGFAPHELAVRIDDAQPKVLLSASCGIEFDKVIPYKPLLDKAVAQAEHKPTAILFFERETYPQSIEGEDLYKDWASAVAQAQPVDPVPVESTHPLYIIYTSGTTGKPKGIVRDNGGHAVAMRFSMDKIYGAKPGEVFWAASDVGWVVGHSYIVYSPLISGCTTVLFEGKPIRTPDAGTFWRMIEEHKVSVMFTAPTAIRAIRKEDAEGELIKKYDISSLRTLFVAGERCDPATLEWSLEKLKIPVIDHWWQTESGWAMLANPAGIELKEIKIGSSALPVPGYQVEVLDPMGNVLGPNEEGAIAIKLPLPPGTLCTLWQNNERFVDAYLKRYEGYYLAGDGGYRDEDNYFYIMGRIDDVINVSGHRLSTGEMEEIVAGHKAVAECAVIGIADSLKGQVPVGLIVLKNESKDMSEEALEKDLVHLIREKIGAVACFKRISIVERLPKTRSGKILRKVMRHIADGEDFQTPSTIDDPAILDEIQDRLKVRKIGEANL